MSHLRALKKFAESIKHGKDPLPYSQITWKETTHHKDHVFKAFKDEVISGKIQVSEIREISSVCHICEIKTDKGKFAIKVIKEVEAYKTGEVGKWGVNPLSIRRLKD